MQEIKHSFNQSSTSDKANIYSYQIIIVILLISFFLTIIVGYKIVNSRHKTLPTDNVNQESTNTTENKEVSNNFQQQSNSTKSAGNSPDCTVTDNERKYIDKTKFHITKTLKITNEADKTFLKVISSGRLNSIENIPYYSEGTILKHHFDINKDRNLIAYVYNGNAYIYNVKTKKLEKIPTNNHKYTDIMFTYDKKDILLTTDATISQYNLQDNSFTNVIDTTNVLNNPTRDDNVQKGYSYSYPMNSQNNKFLFFQKAQYEGYLNVIYDQESKTETIINVTCQMYNCGTVLNWYKNKLLIQYELVDKSQAPDRSVPSGFYFIDPQNPNKKEKIINYTNNNIKIEEGAEILNDRLFFITETKPDGPYYTCNNKGIKVPVNVKYINVNAVILPSNQLLDIAKIPITDTLITPTDINNLRIKGKYKVDGKTYIITTAKHFDGTETIYGIEPNYPFGIVEFKT